MDIRKALPSDLGPTAALFTRSRKLLDFLPCLHTPEEDRGYWRAIVFKKQDVRVATLEGEIVGVIAVQDGWVMHLYVDPTHLRSGIGATLMDTAKRDAGQLDLWCFVENRKALAFYRRQGFVEVARTDGSGNEEKCPDVHLRWTRAHRDI